MKHMRMNFIVGFMACLIVVGFSTNVFAGAGEPPSAANLSAGTIDGEGAWAVVVVEITSSNYINATMRVKRIVGCDVEVETLTYPSLATCDPDPNDGNCPNSADYFKNFCFMSAGLFGGDILNPIITKIKNPDTSNPSIISFDAQIKNFECTGTGCLLP